MLEESYFVKVNVFGHHHSIALLDFWLLPLRLDLPDLLPLVLLLRLPVADGIGFDHARTSHDSNASTASDSVPDMCAAANMLGKRLILL